MSEPKNEYQKFADSAVRARLREEGFGRLRLGLFWGAVGPLAIFLTKAVHFDLQDKRWLAVGIVASAPIAIILAIVNFVRMPNESKGSPSTIFILLLTIVGAGACLALANVVEPSVMKIAFPN
jgi:hypothetical protein